MAGLFPKDGVSPSSTINAINPTVVAGCEVLFHGSYCDPRFNPAAANAMISEITNAVNLVKAYDCNRLDNLSSVVTNDLCTYPEVAFTPEDAYLAGCFAGVSGKINFLDLVNYIVGQVPVVPGFNICQLPVLNDVMDADMFGACIDEEDSKISAIDIKNMLVSNTFGARMWIMGNQVGSLQSLNAAFPTNGRKAFFMQDLRGAGPQDDPGQLSMMGTKIDRLDGPGLPTLGWEYGTIWLMLYIESAGAWFRVHKTSMSWGIPNSGAPVLTFSQNSAQVFIYDATPLLN
jgi:hypothetical protein